MTNLKKYFNTKISSWYENAKIDYDVNGKFIDAITEGDKITIIWEEEGTRYSMTLTWIGWEPETLYNIWMEAEWEEAA